MVNPSIVNLRIQELVTFTTKRIDYDVTYTENVNIMLS